MFTQKVVEALEPEDSGEVVVTVLPSTLPKSASVEPKPELTKVFSVHSEEAVETLKPELPKVFDVHLEEVEGVAGPTPPSPLPTTADD